MTKAPQEIYATARVHLTVEVDAASWQVSSPAEQIFDAAGREAKQKLETILQREHGVRIVGEPKVTLVTGIVK